MKIVQINATGASGSTGKICKSIEDILIKNGFESHILSPERYLTPKRLGFHNKIQAVLTRLDGMYGFHARGITKKQIRELDAIQPDILHLHNLHSHNINLPMLFSWIKKHDVKVVWTFHDCWAFTGHCPHFTLVKCDDWKQDCSCCPMPHEFSWIFDVSHKAWKKKKECISGVRDFTIVTPSHWLADLVKESFLKDYPVKVIHNGIDLDVFQPTYGEFRKKYKIADGKFILLGVAFGWGRRKGLDVFLELKKRLDPEKFQIVLVGTDEKIDQQLPESIISIHRTQNQQELAEIYTAADLFVNPTREENYPTVNMEAIACGTPVITFNTGGSPEMIDQYSGSIVDCDDVDALEAEILRIYRKGPYSSKQCVEKARAFNQKLCFQEYVDLFRDKL